MRASLLLSQGFAKMLMLFLLQRWVVIVKNYKSSEVWQINKLAYPV